MRSFLTIVLLACAAPAPAPTPAGPPDLDTLTTWMTRDGRPPERTGDVLRTLHEGAAGTYEVRVQREADPPLVLLSTSELVRLADTRSDADVVRLMTTMAVQNYELTVGKLQLNPATGGVTVSVELEADGGVTRATFERGLSALTRAADASLPALAHTTDTETHPTP